MKITFVCTGNTCRSPMLMAMFSDYARKVGFDCVTDSAGIMGGGSPVNPKTVCVLRARGIDVGDYTSKVFDGKLAEESDFVFTMTEEQKRYLSENYKNARVECLDLFGGNEVPDPYGMEQSAYDAVGDVFEGMLAGILEYVENNVRDKKQNDK